ncbi:MAG: cupin domain-containing protein [Pseudomonadota bacterium]|nr:cupin domain-containing protein [Pseudomonadota bacterium]
MTAKTVLFASSLAVLAAGTVAYGAEPAAEPAIARTISDPALQWGPCPDFIPKGCGLAVLHGDPAKPNVDVFLKVPAGTTLPNHKHTSVERMVLVAGELQVSYEGQAPMTAKTGTYLYGPAGKTHVATCAKGPDCVLFIAFQEPLDAIPVAQSAQK